MRCARMQARLVAKALATSSIMATNCMPLHRIATTGAETPADEAAQRAREKAPEQMRIWYWYLDPSMYLY